MDLIRKVVEFLEKSNVDDNRLLKTLLYAKEDDYLRELVKLLERSVIKSAINPEKDRVLDYTIPTEFILEELSLVLRYLVEFKADGHGSVLRAYIRDYGSGKSHMIAFLREVLEAIKTRGVSYIKRELEKRYDVLHSYPSLSRKLRKIIEYIEEHEAIIEEHARDLRLIALRCPKRAEPIYKIVLEEIERKYGERIEAGDHVEAIDELTINRLKPTVILLDEIDLRYGMLIEKGLEAVIASDRLFFKLASQRAGLFILVAGNPPAAGERLKRLLEEISKIFRRIEAPEKRLVEEDIEILKIAALAYKGLELGKDYEIEEASIKALLDLISRNKLEVRRERIRTLITRFSAYIYLRQKRKIDRNFFSGLFPVSLVAKAENRNVGYVVSDAIAATKAILDEEHPGRPIVKALLYSINVSYPKRIVERRKKNVDKLLRELEAAGVIIKERFGAQEQVSFVVKRLYIDEDVRRVLRMIREENRLKALEVINTIFKPNTPVKSTNKEKIKEEIEELVKDNTRFSLGKNLPIRFASHKEEESLLNPSIEIDVDAIAKEAALRVYKEISKRISRASKKIVGAEELRKTVEEALKSFYTRENLESYVKLSLGGEKYRVKEYKKLISEILNEAKKEARGIARSIIENISTLVEISAEELREAILEKLKEKTGAAKYIRREEIPISILSREFESALKNNSKITYVKRGESFLIRPKSLEELRREEIERKKSMFLERLKRYGRVDLTEEDIDAAREILDKYDLYVVEIERTSKVERFKKAELRPGVSIVTKKYLEEKLRKPIRGVRGVKRVKVLLDNLLEGFDEREKSEILMSIYRESREEKPKRRTKRVKILIEGEEDKVETFLKTLEKAARMSGLAIKFEDSF